MRVKQRLRSRLILSYLLLGFGLIAAASLHPSMRRATRMGRARPVPVGRGHLGLLSLTILLGPAIVIWRYVERGSDLVVRHALPREEQQGVTLTLREGGDRRGVVGPPP